MSSMELEDLFQSHYSTEEIAEKLLGRLLVHETAEGRVSGFIVETEAYLGVPDMASHSYTGRRTKRTEAMFQEPGTLYVHVMHTHILLNLITQAEGTPEGILIRGIEPYEGVEQMKERRLKHGFQLTNGPGNLTKALGITMKNYGETIYHSSVFLDPCIRRIPAAVLKTPRIGIPNKGIWTDKMLRFIVAGNPYVSRRKNKIASNYGWKEERGPEQYGKKHD